MVRLRINNLSDIIVNNKVKLACKFFYIHKYIFILNYLVPCMVVFMYHKIKYITLFYLLSRVTYSTIHCRIFCRILSGYNHEIWYIFEFSRILLKPYPFSYMLITIRIRDRIRQLSDRIRFCVP
jgi:hypothetical protein